MDDGDFRRVSELSTPEVFSISAHYRIFYWSESSWLPKRLESPAYMLCGGQLGTDASISQSLTCTA